MINQNIFKHCEYSKIPKIRIVPTGTKTRFDTKERDLCEKREGEDPSGIIQTVKYL